MCSSLLSMVYDHAVGCIAGGPKKMFRLLSSSFLKSSPIYVRIQEKTPKMKPLLIRNTPAKKRDFFICWCD